MHTFPRARLAAVLSVALAAPVLSAQQATPVVSLADQMGPAGRVVLNAGSSDILRTSFDVQDVHIPDETVISVVPRTTRELIIHGRGVGTVTMILAGQAQTVFYDVVVDPPITALQQTLQAMFPAEDIRVTVNEGAVILSGSVSNNETMLRVGEIAEASAPNVSVINLLQLPGGVGSKQVSLQVRIAEVNRRAIQEAGISLFTTRPGFTARSTTQQFAAPDFDDEEGSTEGLVFADYLNLFFFQREEGIGGVVRALEQNGWLESLAEPNLIAYDGEEASFLAGGEIPFVFSTGLGAETVQWKEYGVRLRFTPTIAGDVIRLSVDPEVSTLDFANGVTTNGVRVPALQTRRAHTVVELRDGQSFAIAGLLDTINQEDASRVPFLSSIPIIGHLFRSRARREVQTDLMVLITPRLVRPFNPDEVPPLPSIIRAPGRGGGGGGGGDEADLADLILGGAGLMDAPPIGMGTGGGRR